MPSQKSLRWLSPTRLGVFSGVKIYLWSGKTAVTPRDGLFATPSSLEKLSVIAEDRGVVFLHQFFVGAVLQALLEIKVKGVPQFGRGFREGTTHFLGRGNRSDYLHFPRPPF
jgi:hypothetical protein